MDFSLIRQEPNTLDPKTAGLKSGIEIHQQLATKKLFCDCNSEIIEGEPDAIIERRLRPSIGEDGDADAAMLHETWKAKQFRYHVHNESTCLIELDEEPPKKINKEAMNVAVQVAKLLKADLLPKIQIMRKTNVDGSNTSGFQRTALYGFGGKITGEFGSVGIQSLCIEEESAKIVERTALYDTYNLSRLGIPLIEIATDPDMNTPEAIQQVSAHIGMLLRSTRKVRRGLGTIRQDINISITGGERVELKGVQDLKTIPDVVRNEMARQKALLELANILPEHIDTTEIREVSSVFTEPKKFLASATKHKQLYAIGLKNMKGLLGAELYPQYRVGSELAGYAKANGFGGIIHADEEEIKYAQKGLFAAIRKQLHLNEKDSFLILAGPNGDQTLNNVIRPRIQALTQGVPSEVRKAKEDSTTQYLRPMPGAARMYPETDLPPYAVDTTISAPPLLAEQLKTFQKKYSLHDNIVHEAFDTPLFEELAEKLPLEADFIAEVLINYPKEIRKREQVDITEKIKEEQLPEILLAYHNKKIPKSAIYELLVTAGKGNKLDYTKYKQLDEKELAKIIENIINADPNAPMNAHMGKVMAKVRGKADGKLVMELLKKHSKK